jgi:vacuolar-type H+-ATPase subunit E/Vma4
MSAIQTSDLNRMIRSIEAESRTKIKELRIKSISDYNSLKANFIEELSRNIQNEFQDKSRAILQYKDKQEGILRNKLKIQIEILKNQVFQKIFQKVENQLQACELNPIIIEQCKEKADIEDSDLLVFCMPKDRQLVKEFTNFEIKDLPAEALGGIILCNRTGTSFYDNSYQTRLEIIKERYLKEINKRTFN